MCATSERGGEAPGRDGEVSWTVGFVGAGVMGETLVAGLVERGGFDPGRIVVADAHPGRPAELAARYGVRAADTNLEAVARADLAVLAVKPQHLPEVLAGLRGRVPPRTVILSIVAGARLDLLARGLEHPLVARAMPNLPCRIHRGTSVWIAAEGVDPGRVVAVLGCMGEAIRADHERDVDRATAVSGTGPAIVAEFVKSLVEAASYLGQPRELAHETVLATVLGTVEMIRASDRHVAVLIDEVTSPGGTTSRALQVLKQGRFSAVLTEAIEAAWRRTEELAGELERTCG